ncbi:MAG: GMC family oxidoreductase [Gaiellales bacterium]
MTTTADVVVIGGGSAGAVIAARLAEAGRDVVLVEAGPDFGPHGAPGWPHDLVDATTLALSHDWGYTSGDGRWTFERARVIGGCSAHNGAIAAVGHRADYDGWGLPGWTGADVEPLFATVIERMRVRTYTDDEAVPFHRHCLEATRDLGWRMASDLCDLDANDGFGLETVNVVGRTRWNTAFAYLDPVRGHRNLTILDRTLVDRFEETPDGVTVHAICGGRTHVIEAGTLVLAAGAYGTPLILQRSGVGDAERLRAAGVEPVLDLPGVGANLHDHPLVLVDRAIGDDLQADIDAAAAAGFLPEEQTLGKAVSSQSPDGLFDLHVFPVLAADQTHELHGRVAVVVSCVTPASRGRIDIASPDPEAHPVIDHRYLSDPAGHDVAVLRDGVRIANEILDHPAVAAHVGAAVTDLSTDEAIRANVAHYYHPVGTAKMGTGPDAVCDATGRVHGLSRVVVGDASLYPQIMRGNTNLPAVMTGERIAQLLLIR